MADSTSPSSPRPAGYIDGIYNYCDHWCARCTLSHRCRLFRDGRAREAALAAGDDPAAVVKRLWEEDLREAEAARTPAQMAEFQEFLEHANESLTSDDEARLTAFYRRREAWLEAHPVALASQEYSELSHTLSGALRTLPAGGLDEVAIAALDVIEWFAVLIPTKTLRALTGSPGGPDPDEDDDDEGRVLDARGSAKVARLAIAQSREAWGVLMQIGHAAADGVPTAMVQRLSQLDAALAALFPDAMSFQRPGFDDESPESGSGA